MLDLVLLALGLTLFWRELAGTWSFPYSPLIWHVGLDGRADDRFDRYIGSGITV